MVLIEDNSKVLAIDAPMPYFTLPSVDGSTIDSKSIDAKILCVVFTCNHCPYAKAIEPRLIALAYEFEDQDVQFVLISSNDATDYPEDSFENMKQRSEEKDYPFPYCYDESQEVAKAFGALCTPHCFLFDETRKLRYKGRVDDNWKDESAVTQRNLRDAIVALTQGNDPPVAEANAIGCSIKWKS
jgi:peroxiredoxin